jgi:two-component system, OmpR family, sensor histidine kinase MprB
VSFRARLTIAAAAAVAIAVVIASVVVYFVVRSELRAQVDDALTERAEELVLIPGHAIDRIFRTPTGELGGAAGYPQLVTDDGEPIRPPGETASLPITEEVLEVARGERSEFLDDATVGGTHVRYITVPFRPAFALQVARPLTEVDDSLKQIRTLLLIISIGGIAGAAALGLVVTRAALAPVRRLTETTERVTETRDLSERIDATGRDELGRLAASFNTMLAALEESTRAQRQLVLDASHELRTPLTSLRTNIEVLASEKELPAGERERLLSDVVEQLDELTALIGELMVLARGEQPAAEPEDVRLDLVTADAVERIRRNRPGVTFATELEESVVHGVPATIERAVGNLLDNAAKWSPPGGEIEVAVRDGSLTVRDHGPGIEEADLPFVFDRFWRAPSARGMPGSGLGLAIVHQVAEAHGGDVVAERAEGGGTRVTLRLNGLVAERQSTPSSVGLEPRPLDRSAQTDHGQSPRS